MGKTVVTLLCTLGLFASASLAGGPYKTLQEARKEKDSLDAKDVPDQKGLILESKDGDFVVITLQEAHKSETLKLLIDDFGTNSAIPLPKISTEALVHVSQGLKFLVEGDPKAHEEMHRLTLNAMQSAELALAANFLHIPELLEPALSHYSTFFFNKKALDAIKDKNSYLALKAKYIDPLPADLDSKMVKFAWPFLKHVAIDFGAMLNNVNNFVFSTDSEWFVTAAKPGKTRLWRAQTTNKTPMPLADLGTSGAHPVLTRDGKWIAVADIDRLKGEEKDNDYFYPAGLWKLDANHTWNLVARLKGKNDQVEFSPDGKWLVAVDLNANEYQFFRTEASADPRPIREIESGDMPKFSTDGKKILTWEGQAVSVWEMTDGGPQHIRDIRGPDVISKAEFSPDPHSEYIALSTKNITSLWRMQGVEPETVFSGKSFYRTSPFSPDGKWLITSSEDNSVRLWHKAPNLNPFQSAAVFSHKDEVFSAVFSPDGKWIATACADDFIRLFKVKADEHPAPTLVIPYKKERDHDYVSLEFSSDGKWIASSNGWGLMVFSTEPDLPRSAILEVEGDGGKVMFSPTGDSKFSPNGKWFLSVSHNTSQLVALPDLKQLELASAQIIAFVHKNNIKTREALPPHLRDALVEHPYADEFLFGPQKPIAEPPHKKHAPEQK